MLAEAIPAIVRAFPWPKSQRWGAASLSTESLRWVRPLSGIVALFGEDLVECEVGGIRSGYATMGHRFHHPGEITIGSAARLCRTSCAPAMSSSTMTSARTLIREQARGRRRGAGLVLVEDEGLVVENAGLTEWPVPLLGRFDAAFLEVPPEVIQLTARTNQKYFVCRRRRTGKLANAFVCTANIVATDGGAAIVAGNRKVLAARLSDARFFWEQDRKKTLARARRRAGADHLPREAGHGRRQGGARGEAGALAGGRGNHRFTPPLQGRGRAWGSPDRASASGIAPTPAPLPDGEGLDERNLADLAEQAARLCKADLVTEMVGEFPELQGLMGGYYARAEGLPDAVADAIRDHYKPVGQGDDVPTAPVTVAVSLADKLDTLACVLSYREKPTGSKDPFALRRAAIGSMRYRLIQSECALRLSVLLCRSTGCSNARTDPDIAADHFEALDDIYEVRSVLIHGKIRRTMSSG